MLSPKIKQTSSFAINSLPKIKAWAIPSGLFWVWKDKLIPNFDPSPNRLLKISWSSGVVIINMSLISANINTGHGLVELLNEGLEIAKKNMATIFGYNVDDPHRYGVVEFDKDGGVISLEEKPKKPKNRISNPKIHNTPRNPN